MGDPGPLPPNLLTILQSLSKPKIVAGKPITGPQLAALLQQTVEALNTQEIPNVGLLIEAFNADLTQRAVQVRAQVCLCVCRGSGVPGRMCVMSQRLIEAFNVDLTQRAVQVRAHRIILVVCKPNT